MKRWILKGMLAVAGVSMLLFTGCGRKMDKYELRELGIEAMRAGDYEGAKQRFAEALDASKGQVSKLQYDILKYRAECELHLQQYEEAKNTYTILSELDTDAEDQKAYQAVLSEMNGMDQLSEAKALMDGGDYQGAYEKLDPLADLNTGMVGRIAWFNRAVCMENLQRFSEAEENFSQYLEVYPDDEAAQKEDDFLKTR